jgi:hypothetical protein
MGFGNGGRDARFRVSQLDLVVAAFGEQAGNPPFLPAPSTWLFCMKLLLKTKTAGGTAGIWRALCQSKGALSTRV